MAKYLTKPDPAKLNGPPAMDPEADTLTARLPAIVEYLSCDKWEDGTARQTSTINLFVEEGTVKACLHDREEDRLAFVSGTGLFDVLVRLEAGLQEGDLDWRRKRALPKRR